MTIATPERYAEMLEAARRGGYAYPAINVTSSQTLNAALKGFADAESDGIIQISVGGAAYVSGRGVNDRVTGSLALAAFAHEVAAKYPNITIALHTDHCAKQYLDEWARPLLAQYKYTVCFQVVHCLVAVDFCKCSTDSAKKLAVFRSHCTKLWLEAEIGRAHV